MHIGIFDGAGAIALMKIATLEQNGNMEHVAQLTGQSTPQSDSFNDLLQITAPECICLNLVFYCSCSSSRLLSSSWI
jgi:hypothetical protein